MGVCACFSVLFGKLWHSLLGTGCNDSTLKLKLKLKNLILPTVTLFIANLMTLIYWSAILLEQERVAVIGQLWNALEIGCWAALGFINIGALLACCWQALKAKNHSDEFIEENGIHIILFSLLQLTLIGGFVMLLPDKEEEEVTVPYFVTVGLVSLLRVSLLLCMFVHIWNNMGLVYLV
jgi:hypothetical protein